MNQSDKNDDELRPFRFLNVTILQWMAILAIVGIVGYWLLSRYA